MNLLEAATGLDLDGDGQVAKGKNLSAAWKETQEALGDAWDTLEEPLASTPTSTAHWPHDLKGVLTRGAKDYLADLQEEQPPPAPAPAPRSSADDEQLEVDSRKYVTWQRLKLRVGASLTSQALGDVPPGASVRILQRTMLPDGTQRARIAWADEELDPEDESASFTPLGWVTSCPARRAGPSPGVQMMGARGLAGSDGHTSSRTRDGCVTLLPAEEWAGLLRLTLQGIQRSRLFDLSDPECIRNYLAEE